MRSLSLSRTSLSSQGICRGWQQLRGAGCPLQGAKFQRGQPGWKGTRNWLKIQFVGHSQHGPTAAVVWKIPQSLMLGMLEQDRAGRGHRERAMARRARRDEPELSSAENEVTNVSTVSWEWGLGGTKSHLSPSRQENGPGCKSKKNYLRTAE